MLPPPKLNLNSNLTIEYVKLNPNVAMLTELRINLTISESVIKEEAQELKPRC